jgi:hypothetical protein
VRELARNRRRPSTVRIVEDEAATANAARQAATPARRTANPTARRTYAPATRATGANAPTMTRPRPQTSDGATETPREDGDPSPPEEMRDRE